MVWLFLANSSPLLSCLSWARCNGDNDDDNDFDYDNDNYANDDDGYDDDFATQTTTPAIPEPRI